MIVTCQNCDTSFQLDEARVPEQGIRVRCSRCKEAFFLQHPSASQSEAIHSVAAEAADAEGPPSPSPTEDLTAQSGGLDGQPGAGEHEEDDAADWEFNVDPSAAVAEDENEGGRGGGFSAGAEHSGLSLEGEDEDLGAGEGPAVDAGAAETPLGEGDLDSGDHSAFGSVDDFSSLMEEDDLEQGVSSETSEASGSEDPLAAAPAAEVGQYSVSGSADDLGEPESWDFFGGEGESASSGAGAGGSVLGRIELAPAGSVTGGELLSTGEAWDDELYAPESAEPGFVMVALGWIGHGLGWSITLGLLALGLTSGLRPTVESLMERAQTLEVGPLSADSVQGFWVDTAHGETFLGVSGVLHNRGHAEAAPGGIVQAYLVGPDGERLPTAPQPIGLAPDTRTLRESSRDALSEVQSQAALALSQTWLAPGEARDVMAIFWDVPDRAVRLAIEVAPTKQPERAKPALDGAETEPALAADAEGAAVLEQGVAATDEGAAPDPANAVGEGTAGPADDELTWGE